MRILRQFSNDFHSSEFTHSSDTSKRTVQRRLSLPTVLVKQQQLNIVRINKFSEHKTMFESLKVRKQALEHAMNKKLAELRALCLKEGELTGELPPETPLEPNEPIPQIRRRIGTAFNFSDKLLLKPKSENEEILSKLELEYEIQSKIVFAASKLTNELPAKKSVRKQRKQVYQQSLAKLKDLESRLSVVRHQIASTKLQKARLQSAEDLSEDNISHSTDESQEKTETNLNAFIVTKRNDNENKIVKRNGILNHSEAVTDKRSNCSKVKPISTNEYGIKVIQRPRSAAAKSELDYDTDEESNKVMRDLHVDKQYAYDHYSGSVGNRVSVIYDDNKSKFVLKNITFVNQNLNDESNVFSVQNCQTHTSNSVNTEHDYIIMNNVLMNKTRRELQNEFRSYLSRSNSLDNSRRKGTNARRLVRTPQQPVIQCHHHYKNHYPSHRVPKTEILPNNMNPITISHDYTERSLPAIPIVKAEEYQTITSNHCDGKLTVRNSHEEHNPFDKSELQIKEIKDTFLSNNDVIDGCVSKSAVAPTNQSIATYSHSLNSISLPTSPSVIKAKTWTETSLDFVIQPKRNSIKNIVRQQNSTSLQKSSESVQTSPILLQSTDNSEPKREINSPIFNQNAQHLNYDLLNATNSLSHNNLSKLSQTQSALPQTLILSNGVEVNVVSFGHFQPYWEEEKPYELSDFYKYSTKHRKNAIQKELENKLENKNRKVVIDVNENSTISTVSQSNSELLLQSNNLSPNAILSTNHSETCKNIVSIESVDGDSITLYEHYDRNENATLV